METRNAVKVGGIETPGCSSGAMRLLRLEEETEEEEEEVPRLERNGKKQPQATLGGGAMFSRYGSRRKRLATSKTIEAT